MLLVPCPHCGPRNASEFRSRGEVRRRPEGPAIEPVEWRRYLYVRQNPVGWTTETWFHQAGCRRFLVVERHTVTNEIRVVRPPAGPGGTGVSSGEAAGSGVPPGEAAGSGVPPGEAAGSGTSAGEAGDR